MATSIRCGPCRWTARCRRPSRSSISPCWPVVRSSQGCTAMAAPPAPDPPAAARSLHEVVRTEDWVLSAEALMELSLFVFVLVLAYANGTNDVSKAIATLVGSGRANYRSTVLWGAIWTTVGAAASGVVAGAMLNAFSTGLLQPGVAAPPALAGAVVVGAIAWVLLASPAGLPGSPTHAPPRAPVGGGLVGLLPHGLAR